MMLDLRLLIRATKPPTTTEPNCSASILDWITFILALSLLFLSWWVFEVPTLFIPESHQDAILTRGNPKLSRFRRFLRAIAWNCVRAISHSYVASVALARSLNAREWPALYYFGHEIEAGDEAARQLTSWQWARIILMDASYIVAECLLVYRGAAQKQIFCYSFDSAIKNNDTNVKMVVLYGHLQGEQLARLVLV
jgi:hypothetical protein